MVWSGGTPPDQNIADSLNVPLLYEVSEQFLHNINKIFWQKLHIIHAIFAKYPISEIKV